VTDFFDELEKTSSAEDYFDEMRRNYMHQPNEISLETFSYCNASCTFCPYPVLERKGDRMPDELIDRVIGEMSEFQVPFYFSPFKVNEPLLDTRLESICQRVDAQTIASTRIFTNGAALTQRHIDWIGSLSRLQHLWISLNYHDQDEYQRVMGIPFEKTAKRLDNLHGQGFPYEVVLSTVGFPNEVFRNYCFDRWPEFTSVAIQKSEWLGYTDSQVDTVPVTPCSRWFDLSVMSSGVVSLCCMDGEGQFPLGDITRQTLLEVYNSPNWRRRREQMLSRQAYPACEVCTY